MSLIHLEFWILEVGESTVEEELKGSSADNGG